MWCATGPLLDGLPYAVAPEAADRLSELSEPRPARPPGVTAR